MSSPCTDTHPTCSLFHTVQGPHSFPGSLFPVPYLLYLIANSNPSLPCCSLSPLLFVLLVTHFSSCNTPIYTWRSVHRVFPSDAPRLSFMQRFSKKLLFSFPCTPALWKKRWRFIQQLLLLLFIQAETTPIGTFSAFFFFLILRNWWFCLMIFSFP